MAMEIIHNNVLYSHLNDEGARILDFPITKSECVDGLDERIKQVSALSMDGYNEADKGQVPSKSEEGLDWITPVTKVCIGTDGTTITPTDSGKVIIPIAGQELGVVKESDEIGIESDGSISLKSVNADKVMFNSEDTIKEVLNQRTSWQQF